MRLLLDRGAGRVAARLRRQPVLVRGPARRSEAEFVDVLRDAATHVRRHLDELETGFELQIGPGAVPGAAGDDLDALPLGAIHANFNRQRVAARRRDR